MKNIKSFENFVNEGIRDKMTPKSEEDIKASLDKLTPRERLRQAAKMDVYSKDEIKKILEEIPDNDFLKKFDSLSIENKVLYIREFGLSKLLGEDELKSLLLERIKKFFDKSSRKDYDYYDENTNDIDGIYIFKTDDNIEVSAIDTDGIYAGNNFTDYEFLSIRELNNVIESFIESIEYEEDKRKQRFRIRN